MALADNGWIKDDKQNQVCDIRPSDAHWSDWVKMPRMPVEMTMEILKQLPTADLLSTTLVCQTWRHLSQETLFKNVTVNGNCITCFVRSMKSPRLCHLVHNLRIICGSMNSHTRDIFQQLRSISKDLIHMKTLIIVCMSWTMNTWRTFRTTMSPWLPSSCQTLTLHVCEGLQRWFFLN